MQAKMEEITTNAIKSFVSTIWPFIGFAFALIQYIYARDNAQTAADRAEVKKDVQDLKADSKTAALLMVEYEGRIKRVEEKSEENRSSISETAKRIADVEKTYIYTMPNEYRR